MKDLFMYAHIQINIRSTNYEFIFLVWVFKIKQIVLGKVVSENKSKIGRKSEIFKSKSIAVLWMFKQVLNVAAGLQK